MANTGDYMSYIDIGGNWQITPLLQRYHPGFAEYLEGGGEWTASVDLATAADRFNYTLEIRSALAELASALPAPFEKESGVATDLYIVSEGNQQASTVVAHLGENITFTGILPTRICSSHGRTWP